MTEGPGPVFIAFIRGINVGGKSSVPMVKLRTVLTQAGFADVSTLLNSGNVILRFPEGAKEVGRRIENVLRDNFCLEPNSGSTHVISASELRRTVTDAPAGFGSQPDKYHSDVIFLMGVSEIEALTAFSPRDGIDTIWQGHGVIYSQRLSAERTKSRLNRAMSHPVYKSMTIRTWNTVLKLDSAASTLAGD